MGRKRAPPPVLGVTQVTTRDQARMNGKTIYFDGKYCVQGHLDWRYASTGQCRSCQQPPPPVTRYVAEGPYRFTTQQKVRLLAQPVEEFQQADLTRRLEKAAKEWAVFWKLAEDPDAWLKDDEPTY